MIEHDQVLVTSPNGEVEVDAGIVHFLEKLWNLGFETDMSCQNINGFVWIKFSHACHADDFVHLLLDGVCNIVGETCESLAVHKWNNWFVHRMCNIQWEPKVEPNWKISFSAISSGISLWIPMSDMGTVEDLLGKHLNMNSA